MERRVSSSAIDIPILRRSLFAIPPPEALNEPFLLLLLLLLITIIISASLSLFRLFEKETL